MTDSKVECPTCGDSFSSDRGMKIHHSKAHGESIAGIEVECQSCGAEFRKSTSHAKRVSDYYCSRECFLDNKKHGRDELLQELLRLQEELGRTPAQTHLEKHGKFSRVPYEREFDGGWNQALREAGMHPNREHQSREDCLQDIRRTAENVGHTPTVTEQREIGEVSISHISRVFDSWKTAISEAGLDETQVKQIDISKSEIKNDIQRVSGQVNGAPTKSDMRKHGRISGQTAARAFGSFVNACKAAGVGVNRKEPITVECEGCSQKIQRYEYHVERSENLFCSKECHTDWLRDGNAPRGPEHHQFNPDSGENATYGPNWPKQRERARNRDNHNCQSCGMSSSEHKEKYGMDLHVHHITPWHHFDDHKERNKLSNLITLCASCHAKYESIPVKPQIATNESQGGGQA